MKYATGNFIIFCDADDYYSSSDFLDVVAAKITNSTDIVVFNYSLSYTGGGVHESRRCISELEDTYSTGCEYLKAALAVRYDYRWYPVLYAFRQELFDTGIEFPREKLGEDTATIYKLILRARTIKVEKRPFYIYRINSGNNLTAQKTYEALAGTVNVAKRCVEDISNQKYMDVDLKAALCNNFAVAYFTALIQANYLEKDDLKKLIELLRKEIELMDYATSPKQMVARRMVQVLGLRMTATIFEIRRRLREKNNTQRI